MILIGDTHNNSSRKIAYFIDRFDIKNEVFVHVFNGTIISTEDNPINPSNTNIFYFQVRLHFNDNPTASVFYPHLSDYPLPPSSLLALLNSHRSKIPDWQVIPLRLLA